MNDSKKKPQGENIFGGKNQHGLYIPMSEDEQEVLQRLIETQDLQVIIKGWNVKVENPPIQFGDLRVHIPLHMEFMAPRVPRACHFLDLELRTGSGELLVKERHPTIVNGHPLQVARGVVIDFVWDIAIQNMDPKFVKCMKPGALGLTSRRIDRDTGEVTPEGNMTLNSIQKRIAHTLAQEQDAMQAADIQRVVEVSLAGGMPVRRVDDGYESPDTDDIEQ